MQNKLKSMLKLSIPTLLMGILFINSINAQKKTQAELLGFDKGKKILILHADDAGMSPEANEATEFYLENGLIQSAAVMMPCPSAEAFLEWTKTHPKTDIGLHLTLTSEWKTYRWGPVADPVKVPGLIDPSGKLWPEVPDVVMHANAKEIEIEIRAQIDKSISFGWNPTHIDSHMGTVFGSPEYTRAYLKVAEEYGIPAMVIDLSNIEMVNKFRKVGFAVTDEVIEMVDKYKLPKLDDFTAVPKGATYEEVRENFYKHVISLDPGITELIFHPAIATQNLKSITHSWRQRSWEAKIFSDPEVIKFLKDEGIVFTNWIDVMNRFNGRITNE